MNEILSEEKIKEGQTDPVKTSAYHRMIAIVHDEEIQQRKAYRIPQNRRVWFESNGRRN